MAMTPERLEDLRHRSETCDLCLEFAKEGVRELIEEVERLQELTAALEHQVELYKRT